VLDGAAADALAIGNGGQVLSVSTPKVDSPTLTVFDGAHEHLLATVAIKNSFAASLLAYDRATRTIVMSATSGSWLERFKFDEQTFGLTEGTMVMNAGTNGQDLAMSPDGRHVAFVAGAGNGNGYAISDLRTQDFSVVDGEWATGPYPRSAAFSPDGKYLAATDGRRLLIFSANTHQLIDEVTQDQTNCYYYTHQRVAFSRGSRIAFLLTASCDESARTPGRLTWLVVP